MRTILISMATVLCLAGSAFAQDVGLQGTTGSGATEDMAALIKNGYEIKTAVQNGKNVIVFLQKDTTAYVCEFSSLQNSRCGAIN